jgi:manganese/zinc/iron transport system ATP- binding protein
MKPVIHIENLTAVHDQNIVLRCINAQIMPGTMIGILGPNGAGKSTLFKLLIGTMRPFAGKVIYANGMNIKNIAYVPQRIGVDWDFPITVKEVVLMGRYGHIGWFAKPTSSDYDKVFNALEKVGMLAYADRPIAELSGGQQQRIFLARALVQEPTMYLLDEPLVGIDMPTERIIIDILQQERNQGKTVLMIHHDLHTASTYFDHLMLINVNLIAFGPATQIHTKEYISRTYTPTGMR